MHLREITNEQVSTAANDCTIKLDEQVVSEEELAKRKEDKSVRIVEVSKNNFKTLKHLR